MRKTSFKVKKCFWQPCCHTVAFALKHELFIPLRKWETEIPTTVIPSCEVKEKNNKTYFPLALWVNSDWAAFKIWEYSVQKHPQCLRRRAAEQFSCFIYNIFTSAVCTDKHTQTRIGINSAPVSPFLRGQLRKNAKVCCRVSDHSLSSWLTSYRHITWVITYRNGIEERSEKGNKHRDRDHLSCNPLSHRIELSSEASTAAVYSPRHRQGGA